MAAQALGRKTPSKSWGAAHPAFLFESGGDCQGPKVRPRARHFWSDMETLRAPHRPPGCVQLPFLEGAHQPAVMTNPQLRSESRNKAVSHPDWMTRGPKSTTLEKCHHVMANDTHRAPCQVPAPPPAPPSPALLWSPSRCGCHSFTDMLPKQQFGWQELTTPLHLLTRASYGVGFLPTQSWSLPLCTVSLQTRSMNPTPILQTPERNSVGLCF